MLPKNDAWGVRFRRGGQSGLQEPRLGKQGPETDDPRVLRERIRQLQRQLAESETDKEI